MTLRLVLVDVLCPHASVTVRITLYVPAAVNVAVVLAPVLGLNVIPVEGKELHEYVNAPVPVAEPVKLAVVPVMGFGVLTVINAPLGAEGFRTVTVAFPDAAPLLALTVSAPIDDGAV